MRNFLTLLTIPAIARRFYWFRIGKIASVGILMVTSSFVLGSVDRTVAIEGSYNYSFNLSNAGRGEQSSQGSFRVSIQPSSWIVAYTSATALTNATETDLEVTASCDETNVYVVRKLNPLAMTQRDAIMTEAQIYPGTDIPPMLEKYAYNLWLAFISSKVWTNTEGKAKPPNTADLGLFYNPECKCNYLWTTNNNESCLRSLILKSDARFLTRDYVGNGKPIYFTLKQPYQNGYVMGQACWFGITNISGLVIPTKYEFSYFIPSPKPSSDMERNRVYSYQFTMTNITVENGESIPSGFRERRGILVFDHRFEKQGHATVTFVTTNGLSSKIYTGLAARVLTMSKVSFEDESLERLGFKAPMPAGDSKGTKTIFIRITLGILMALPIGALLAIAWSRSRKKMKNNRNKRK